MVLRRLDENDAAPVAWDLLALRRPEQLPHPPLRLPNELVQNFGPVDDLGLPRAEEAGQLPRQQRLAAAGRARVARAST